MQAWEYLFLNHVHSSSILSSKGETFVNDASKPRYKQSSAEFYSWCNQLGSEGWELVGIHAQNGAFMAALKRPKEAVR